MTNLANKSENVPYKINPTPPNMLLRSLLLCALVCAISADSMLVTVQSQSQADMDAITAAVDDDAHDPNGSMRMTLGAIEATMSRVVDVDSPYFQAPVQAVPTWGLLQDVSYDRDTSIWTFKYNTMAKDPSSTLNQFHRVLYMTRQGGAKIGDTDNVCLDEAVDINTCFTELNTQYTVPESITDATRDYLIFHDSSSGDKEIQTTVTVVPNSLMEEVVITIPHKRIREGATALAVSEQKTHAVEGVMTQWTFGIGVLFHGSGNNVVVFDRFNLIENNMDQMAMSVSNNYALARHAFFYTRRVADDHTIRVAIMNYELEPGYELQSITESVNGASVTTAQCAAMQAKIDALADKQCIVTHDLCTPQIISSSTANGVIQSISSIIPIPADAGNEYALNTMFKVRKTGTTEDLLSTLNFKTSSVEDVCAAPIVQAFTPAQHISVSLYQGYALNLQTIDGAFTIQNSTAMGMPETLLTLVLAPKDAAADTYFADFPSEHINLDDLYLSHAIDDAHLPSAVSNTITGTSNGRSQINLDPTLLAACPLETDIEYNTGITCVTTRDWTQNGRQLDATQPPRPKSSPTMYFVRRVTNSADDKTWLSENIFANDGATAQTFMDRTDALVQCDAPCVSSTRRAASEIYWIWPIYQYADQSPIGLKDKTILSFAWSVSSTAPTSRRLLSFPFERVAKQFTSSSSSQIMLNKQYKKTTKKLTIPTAILTPSKPMHLHYIRKQPSKSKLA